MRFHILVNCFIFQSNLLTSTYSFPAIETAVTASSASPPLSQSLSIPPSKRRSPSLPPPSRTNVNKYRRCPLLTVLVLPEGDPSFSSSCTTSMPSTTLPNTTCFPSSQGQSTVHKKNWLPLVLGPAFACRGGGGGSRDKKKKKDEKENSRKWMINPVQRRAEKNRPEQQQQTERERALLRSARSFRQWL